jgi:hypothetical protein
LGSLRNPLGVALKKTILPDFIDLQQLLTADLRAALLGAPHLLKDLSGKEICS